MTWLSGKVAVGWGGDGAVPGHGLKQLLFPSAHMAPADCLLHAHSTLLLPLFSHYWTW